MIMSRGEVLLYAFYFLFYAIALVLSTWTAEAQETAALDPRLTTEQICASAQSSCRQCILAHPKCTWCFDNQATPGTRQIRCRTMSENEKHCLPDSIENPVSEAILSRNKHFSVISNYSNVDNQEVIQMRPQALTVKLRKGLPKKVNLTFKKVVDYPLDLYYVMDLSHSMSDDLNQLQKLGSSLVDQIRSLTSNVRLGFGTFVDKVMLPFASTIPEQLEDPCQNQSQKCAPVFGFRHQLSVTSNGTAFKDAVDATRISGNIDSPEGGFDALMQIAVCQEEIQWRPEALRVILFTSDASPHIAMDGKLAAILEKNDMKCHLRKGVNKYLSDDAIVYAESKLQDYPSIGQLKKAFDDNKIQTIFAVTKDVLGSYEDLPEILENSYVDVLKSDSSNVVKVISTSYNALRSKIQLARPSVPDNLELSYRVLCPDASGWMENRLECTNVSIGDEVVFQFEIKATDCPSDGRQNDVIRISSSSIRDVVNLTIDYICDCGCLADKEKNSSSCSNNGNLECGICSCNEGIRGLQCQCTESTTGLPLDENCTRGEHYSGKAVCSGQGFCECGKCQCGGDYFGQFCECRRSGCPEDSDGLVCGGKIKGLCVNCNNNPTCECHKTPGGWTLDMNSKLCSCNEKFCKASNMTATCDGHGTCDCDMCKCDSTYNGPYCENCIHPSCIPIVGDCGGVKIRECAECVYEQGRLNVVVADVCATVCKDQGINFNTVPSLPNCYQCQNSEPSKECDLCKGISIDPTVHEPRLCETNPFGTCIAKYGIVWDVEKKEYLVFVRSYDNERDCPAVNPLLIIIPVVGSILLIGIVALIIWKIITTFRDKHEYQRFVQETSKAKWASGESKLYVNPNDRVTNPMFIGNN